MRLIAFEATRLNHLKTVKVSFNDDLTFITGINGTGKTSALASIVALLTPNMGLLADLNFESIKVTFSLESKTHTVLAQKDASGRVKLRASHFKDDFEIEPFVYEEDEFYSPHEARVAYYSEMLSENQGNGTLRFLATVPTPMFLGIDRRYQGLQRKRLRGRSKSAVKSNAIFGSNLANSLNQAVALAEGEYAEAQAGRGKLSREFVRDLLLELIDVRVASSFGLIDIPKSRNREELDSAIKAITQFPKVEGITADAVRSRIEPTLKQVKDAIASIPDGLSLDRIATHTKSDRKVLEAVLLWNSFKPNLERINTISRLVSGYNERIKEIERSIGSYVQLIDRFFRDSGKSIGFDERGILQVEFGSDRLSPDELSSGEAQIFVILTHLAFNQAAQQAGVFLIDEPELSLHVQWQEIVVESFMKANPTIQYVLATHSPSIILDRSAQAVDLTRFAEPTNG